MRSAPWRSWLAPLVAGGALLAGGAFHWWRPDVASTIWFVALVVLGAPVVWRTARGLLRARFAADVVA